MRYVSKLFQPILTIPKNAKIKNTEITCKSQKLLVECGLVRPTAPGLFSLLPLARRALDKLEALVKKHIEATGAQQISLPALAAESLWDKSGRLDGVGPELMRFEDRHQKGYLLAPTHEEGIADLLADVCPLSYKHLPLLLYQIGQKYRDEHRPKHGLLRAREFRMLDVYGAHASLECAHHTYARLTEAYKKIFDALNLPVHRVEAPTGEMGGSLSHEWQLCAQAGEDAIDICSSCSHASLSKEEGERKCEKCGNEVERQNSIEVGHTFVLGTKYSEPLQTHFTSAQGAAQTVLMSCYGIGTTRLLAASIEALSSEHAIRWPRPIVPYSGIVIGPKEGSRGWESHGWDVIQDLARRLEECLEDDVLVDDRHNLTVGKRLMMADKMGYPNIVVCGRASLETPPRYELRGSGDQRLLTATELVRVIKEENRTEPAKEDSERITEIDKELIENKVLTCYFVFYFTYYKTYKSIHKITLASLLG